MALYDVKNARLCCNTHGEGFHRGREPVLVADDLDRVVKLVEPLMKSGQDCLWIVGGRTESNFGRIKATLTKVGLRYVTFYLNYNTKLMQVYGHWKRQRGIVNSKSLEQIFLV